MWVGLASVESTVPLLSKSQANVRSVPSGSFEPALENWTWSGAGPLSGVAVAFAIGLRSPAV